MLRSAATPNRTAVQPSLLMKQPTTRQPLLAPSTPSRSAARLTTPQFIAKLTRRIRLFED